MATTSPVALITGASRGIGRGIALELAASGYDVVVNYTSNRDAAEETAREVEARGQTALVARADVASREDREQMVADIRSTFGRIDVLVNNAALSSLVRADLLDAGEESYDRILDVNLKGPFFLSQAIARWMVEIRAAHPDRKLHIVNVSSLSEYAPSVNRGDYCLAKAGMGMLTRLFAVRMAEYAIPVNEVRPGIVATDMTSGVKGKYDKLIGEGLTPIRRWGEPADVARAVRALVSGDFDFVTGVAIDIDGGFHMKWL